MRIIDQVRKGIFLLILLVLPAAMLLANEESYIQTLTGKIKKNDSCTVIDDKFLNMPLAEWNQLHHLAVDNIISFELRFDTTIYYNKPFTCTLNVSVKYFTSRDQQTPDEINNVDLVVKYDTAKGSFYPATGLYKFKNAFKVIVVVNSITSKEWGENIPAIFRLKNQIVVQRKYPFSPVVNGGLQLHAANEGQGVGKMAVMMVTPSVSSNGRQLIIGWTSANFPNAEEYDVEWTYIDALSKNGKDIATIYTSAGVIDIPDNTVERWMRNNSTRVTVKAPAVSYTINLPYSAGYVLVRVRGAYYQVSPAVRLNTAWLYRDDNNKTAVIEITEANAHEPRLNWQYTAAFAEEGKRKEVISYFDGTLRSRQSVTLNNSDLTLKPNSTVEREETAVIQETIYDVMGRGAMNILPAPTQSNSLAFDPTFNLNDPAAQPLSNIDISLGNTSGSCIAGASPLSTGSGASKYYSPQNAFINDGNFYFTKYVPDAGKYPYALTQYTPDNTGRPRRQGSVGSALQIGSGNETQYYYFKTSQTELDRIFGSEVGDASHYLKSMVVDPNGQISISYIDANGKTIATALAGGAPKTVDALPSNTPASKVSMNQSLIKPADFRRDAGAMMMQVSATFGAEIAGPFQINYSIDPASLLTTHSGGQFCSNCYYDVEIKVLNDCGEVKGSQTTTAFTLNDVACNPNPQPFTGTVPVNVDKLGEYTVTYTLKLSEDVVKYQTDYYVEHNTDLVKLQSFFQGELNKLELSGCYTTCEECKTLGSTPDAFRTKVLDLLGTDKFAGLSFDRNNPSDPVVLWINAQWNDLHTKCSQLSCSATSACEDFLQQMKADVMPGGQYALYTVGNFGECSYIERDINVMRLYNPAVDNPGNEVITALYNLTYTDENGTVIYVRTLTESDFIKAYIAHPEWADIFVKAHIEYCSYTWCKDAGNANRNEASYNFDKTIREMVTTGEDAVSRNLYNRQNKYALLDADPFFNNGGRGVTWRDEMEAGLNNISGAIHFNMNDASGNSLPGKDIFAFIDWLLYCKPGDGATATQFVDSWSNCSPNGACRSITREWELYLNYYLKIKSNYMHQTKEQAMPLCMDCFIGKDALVQSECVPPSGLTDYSIVTTTGRHGPVYEIVYKNGTATFPENYQVAFRYNRNDGSVAHELATLTKGALSQSIYDTYSGEITNIAITGITCSANNGLLACTSSSPSLPCPSSSEFHRNDVLQRDPIGEPFHQIWNLNKVYWVHNGNVPLDRTVMVRVTKEVYNIPNGSITYEEVIPMPAGTYEVEVGETMEEWEDSDGDWVQEIDEITTYSISISTTDAVYCVDPPAPETSTCTNDPRFEAYRSKSRIFNDFISEDTYANCLASGSTVIPSDAENLAKLRALAIDDLAGMKSAWFEQLYAVTQDEDLNFQSISLATVTQLTDALYEIAKRNIELATSAATIQPASGLPVGQVSSNGYNSFQDAFNAIIGSTLTHQGFSPYLLDKPYPYNKLPLELDPNVSELNASICTNLAALKSRANPASTHDFHVYLQQELGDDYQLTEAQLADLDSRCTAGCRYLSQSLILPVALASPAYPNTDHPFASCTRISGLESDFLTEFSGVTTGTKLYRILYVNYMNHHLGFALSYGDYLAFKDKCTSNATAVLYNKPASPTVLRDDLACVTDNLKSAYERAGQEYDRYITIIRQQFRNQYIAKCIGNSASASVSGDQYEYHYTLYYYDQSGNLVKTIPPEGVRFLSQQELDDLDGFRKLGTTVCSGSGINAVTDKASILNAFSSGLQNGSGKSLEMWLYNSGSATRQVRIITPDNKYLYQAAISGGKLWVELYTLEPGTNGEISITLSNHAAADISQFGIQDWSHVVLQSSNFTATSWDIYLDGHKLVPLANSPAYPFSWEITGGFTLPAEQLADLKHFRFYNRPATDPEVYQNYTNGCLLPVGALAAQSSPLMLWGRFNVPTPGSETTIGPGSTTEYVERFIVPRHGLATTYAYNSLNSVVQQSSPDGGTSQFWYDRLGRLVVSQNAEQLQSSTGDASNRYSYTQYDALGRIIEVGQKINGNTVTETDSRLESFMAGFYGSGANEQVVQTVYDEAPVGAPGLLTNLRKRVAATIYKATGTGTVQQGSYYDYDISGNIKTLYQYIAALVSEDAGSGVKRVDYEYDLISGKTDLVKYQEGKGDQFYYQYQYDADNRVTTAFTSRDKTIWNLEASYRYYLHGPLARLELGAQKVQGLDYAYTLQGWLKGINGQRLDPNKDMTGDAASGLFSGVARDVMAFSLGYFDNDYSAIGSNIVGINANAFTINYQFPQTFPNTFSGNRLYNANIAYATLALSKLESGATKGYTYRYDQLNRLKQMRMHAIGNSATVWDSKSPLDTYKEDVTYDANGNILTYTRNGDKPSTPMDQFTYHYSLDGANHLLNNKLAYVQDNAPDGNYTEDMDNQPADNYAYDRIGNLIQDKKENLSKVRWTVYGKIGSITKGDEASGTYTTITYQYDAAGNRVSKTITAFQGGQGTPLATTFYVRDAQGNVLGVYKKANTDNKLWWEEQHLYGSSRLGIWKPDLEVTSTWQAPGTGAGTVVVGQRNYELANHLGNVVAVISDKSNLLPDGTHEAEIITTNDYYPFGMQMPGRSMLGPTCHDVVQDLTEFKTSSDLNSGVTQSGTTFTHNGVSWKPQSNAILTLSSGAMKVTNSGGASEGVLALPPLAMVKPNTTYIMECDILEQSAGITGLVMYAIDNTGNPYRVASSQAGVGHHAITFTTGATLGTFLSFRVSASPATAGLYFVVDNFVFKEVPVVNEVVTYNTDMNSAAMVGVNVVDNGQQWTPFTGSITSLSVAGTTDKKIQVNCTGVVNDSRLFSIFNVPDGKKYLLKFSMGEALQDKRLIMTLSCRTGPTGSWVPFQSGIFFTGSGDYRFNFEMPAGFTQMRIELARANTNASYDGLDVPYTVDNFSITQLEPVLSQTSISCDPGADPAGDNGLYRYGFNGKENDNEIKGLGNEQDYGMRIYDTRVGRFLSVDPLASSYPGNSTYAFAENEPISNIDLDGLEKVRGNVITAYGEGIKYGAIEFGNNFMQTGRTLLSSQTYKNAYSKTRDIVVEGVKDPNTLVTRYTNFMDKWSNRFANKVENFATAPGLWVASFHTRTAQQNARDLGYFTWKGMELYALTRVPELFADAEVVDVLATAKRYDPKLLYLEPQIPAYWCKQTDVLAFWARYKGEEIGFWSYTLADGLEVEINLSKNLQNSGLGSKLMDWAMFESEADVFTATWVKSDIYEGGISLNLKQYQENLAKNMSVNDAAWNTWSGRQAKKHGFTKVEVSSIKEGVKARFSK